MKGIFELYTKGYRSGIESSEVFFDSWWIKWGYNSKFGQNFILVLTSKRFGEIYLFLKVGFTLLLPQLIYVDDS